MVDGIYERLDFFIRSRGWIEMQTPENLAKSISIEAAELLELYQWSPDADLERVKEEVADVILYSLHLVMSYDFDLEQILHDKMDKNEIKYPHP